MKTSEIHFEVQDCACSGLLFVPDDWRSPARLPGIIVIPGGSGLRSDYKGEDCGQGLIELAKELARCGFVSFGYDGRGQGQSEGKRTGQDVSVVDLQTALEVMRSECEAIDPNRIGLFGQSAGGMAAIVAAASDSRIGSVVLWGTLPRYSIAKTDERVEVFRSPWEKSDKRKTFAQFVEDFVVIDPLDYISRVRQPILLTGGTEDALLFRPDEQRQLLEAATASSKVMLLEVKGEPHRMRHWAPSFHLVAKLSATWFAETL